MTVVNVLLYTSLLSTIPQILDRNDKLKTTRDESESDILYSTHEETFDYIVVGGGSAGSVLVNRLSSDNRNNVLLLERGGDPDPIQQTPFHVPLQITPVTDYGYYTVPQKNSFHSVGNKYHVLRGRGLGGSGNLNYMIYQRGAANAYDEWAELTGDQIWSWKSVLTYFKKGEAYNGIHQPMDKLFHSSKGEILVSTPNFKPSAKYFFEACREQGVNVEDLNTGIHNAPVFDSVELKTKNGKRWGPYQAFLKHILTRSNLQIYRYAQVVKVDFDECKRAKGVTYLRHGVLRTVYARKEVILSAGAIDTPKILMLSGIGPATHLESLNITVIKDLPVGQNHQDHVATTVDKFVFEKTHIAFDPARDLKVSSFWEYKTRGTGILSVPGSLFATGYYSTSLNPEPDIPDIQYFLLGTYTFGNPLALPVASPVKQLKHMSEQSDSNSVVVTLTRPETMNGEIKLKSSNPADPPLIDPKFFSDTSDMPRLIEGLKYTIGLYQNSSIYKNLGSQLVLTVPDMCKEHEYQSDAFWNCYIRFYTGTVWHPVGSCRMGKPEDSRSVVDSNLRVIGIKDLRVVDGSIMPKIVNCNTQAPIYMIAEVAAELIIGSAAKSHRE